MQKELILRESVFISSTKQICFRKPNIKCLTGQIIDLALIDYGKQENPLINSSNTWELIIHDGVWQFTLSYVC